MRDEADLARIRSYIRANPARWLVNQLHPHAPPNELNKSWRRAEDERIDDAGNDDSADDGW